MVHTNYLLLTSTVWFPSSPVPAQLERDALEFQSKKGLLRLNDHLVTFAVFKYRNKDITIRIIRIVNTVHELDKCWVSLRTGPAVAPLPWAHSPFFIQGIRLEVTFLFLWDENLAQLRSCSADWKSRLKSLFRFSWIWYISIWYYLRTQTCGLLWFHTQGQLCEFRSQY